MSLSAATAGAKAAEPGEETTIPNNLSYPVIWSDGAALTLPGIFGEPEFTAPYKTSEEAPPLEPLVYPQATEGNSWQAENLVATAPVEVSEIDWGDNLEAKSLTPGKPIRVETTLIKTLETPMLAFEMTSITGTKKEEVFGATGATYESPAATIYSPCARMTIQRLLIGREDKYLGLLKWDVSTGEWGGNELAAPAIFNAGVWQGSAEGSGYSAEVNGSGKVIYGYNWRTSGLADGDYRLTFSLEPNCPAATLNTSIAEATKVFFAEEESTAPLARIASSAAGVSGGAVPKIDAADNLSYVDVELGNPAYVPYVPPPETPVTPPPTTTTPVATTTTTTTQQQVQTRTRTRQRVTLHLQRLRPVRGHARYRLWGSVLPRRDGQRLRIQIRTRTGWRTLATVRLRGASATRSQFSITLGKPSRGTYRAYMLGDSKYLAGASPQLRLRP